MTKLSEVTVTSLWNDLFAEVEGRVKKEPKMAGLFQAHVLKHSQFGDALAAVLSSKLAETNPDYALGPPELFKLFTACYADNSKLVQTAKKDLLAAVERDPSIIDLRTPFLFYKGYHALQTHRIAHTLWHARQKDMARFLQSQSSIRFAVDIHPAAQIGQGVMIDHATGIVIGETAVIEDNVSMLHGVTLGGTGKEHGDRHPKIGKGVLIGANATILGNIRIEECSMIAAGSVVLTNIPARVTAAGVPARVVGKATCRSPGMAMDQIAELPEIAIDM